MSFLKDLRDSWRVRFPATRTRIGLTEPFPHNYIVLGLSRHLKLSFKRLKEEFDTLKSFLYTLFRINSATGRVIPRLVFTCHYALAVNAHLYVSALEGSNDCFQGKLRGTTDLNLNRACC